MLKMVATASLLGLIRPNSQYLMFSSSWRGLLLVSVDAFFGFSENLENLQIS